MANEEPKKAPSQYGDGRGQPADEKMVLEGMKSVEMELKAEDRRSHESFAERLVKNGKLREVLITKGMDFKSILADTRAMEDKARQIKVATHSDIKFLKVEPFSFSGSIGATRVPPFDYQWSWESTTNSPSVSKSANRTNGQMSYNMWDNLDNSSSGSARTAIGIYFRPPTRNGLLIANSVPAYSATWGTWCVLADAHTDGWIGLFVGSYNVSDNSYAGTIIDQKNSLFSDDSWWSGIGWRESTNSGYPLSAMFPVDNAHWYAIWVWSGGRIAADGWGGTFQGSGAHSGIVTNIPYMSWTYFG